MAGQRPCDPEDFALFEGLAVCPHSVIPFLLFILFITGMPGPFIYKLPMYFATQHGITSLGSPPS
jgi:hypothetical protein